ncbi:hypothetical protein ACE1OC_00240 [Streptomyces sp. DSM 116496]|uniref:hypothetical protein n=1 Tax=Streptomyces stoeckheimensis TaxID=3344656 RepID=UPI0038B3F884
MRSTKRRPSRRLTGTTAAALAVATLGSTITLMASAPAQAASSATGTISRTEILTRAQDWVDRGITYTQSYTATDTDGGHGYRRDCSGLVAMAWHLGSSPLTNEFLSYAQAGSSGMRVISRDDFRPGDAMVRDSDGYGSDGHMELFSHWKNPGDHTQGAYVYSFNTNGETVENPSAVSNFQKLGFNSWSEVTGYTAIRYDRAADFVDDGVALATSTGSAASTSGRMEAFRISNGRVQNKWQLEPNGGWSGWGDLGGSGLRGGVAAVSNADGRLEVFAVGGDGQLYHKWQQTPGADWVDAWESLGGENLVGVAAGRNNDGRLEVFATASNGRIYDRWQLTAGGGWSAGWGDLGGNGTSSALAVGRNDDGRLEVFTVGGDGQLYHKWQQTPGADWISGWENLGGSALKGVAVGSNADGRLEVFVVAGDGHLYDKWQTVKNGGWVSGFGNLGGNTLSGRVAAATNLDGRLEVSVIGGDGNAFHRWQSVPNGSWNSGWVLL